jgi:hypothetical protein
MQELLAKPKFQLWLAIVGSSTLLLGAAYAMVQQSTRLSANDIPKFTAQNVVSDLNNGTSPDDLVASNVDLASDYLGPFVVVTDNDRNILASSASLNGKKPLPPPGTFDFTKDHGSDRFTWEPASSVREATYMTKYNSGYVIAGQTLKPFENRINTYTDIAAAAWLAIIAWVTLIILMPLRPLKSSRKT